MQKFSVQLVNQLLENELELWLGWVDPMNLRVIAGNSEDCSIHPEMPDWHDMDWAEAPRWRYRKDLNRVYWWSELPDQETQQALNDWIRSKLKKENPTHISIPTVARSYFDKNNVRHSHGGSYHDDER